MKTKHMKNFLSEDKDKPNFKMNEKKPFNFKTRKDSKSNELDEFNVSQTFVEKNIRKNKYYRYLKDKFSKNSKAQALSIKLKSKFYKLLKKLGIIKKEPIL